jgi:hypothetical protein
MFTDESRSRGDLGIGTESINDGVEFREGSLQRRIGRRGLGRERSQAGAQEAPVDLEAERRRAKPGVGRAIAMRVGHSFDQAAESQPAQVVRDAARGQASGRQPRSGATCARTSALLKPVGSSRNSISALNSASTRGSPKRNAGARCPATTTGRTTACSAASPRAHRDSVVGRPRAVGWPESRPAGAPAGF